MQTFLLVALGGALGATLRHALALSLGRAAAAGVPVPILAANVAGSAAMGLLVAALAAKEGGEGWRLFAAVGLLGGFTTFSSFSLEAVQLWQRGEGGAALAYVLMSVILSILGLVVGLAIGRSVF